MLIAIAVGQEGSLVRPNGWEMEAGRTSQFRGESFQVRFWSKVYQLSMPHTVRAVPVWFKVIEIIYNHMHLRTLHHGA